MDVGLYIETLLFYVTKLAPATPIILGMPWLQIHDPEIRWAQPALYFCNEYCRTKCLPWNLHGGVAMAQVVRPTHGTEIIRHLH